MRASFKRKIDLTGNRICCPQRVHRLSERHSRYTEIFKNKQKRNHSIICIGTVSEIVVPARFSSKKCIRLPHARFDKGVSTSVENRCAVRGNDSPLYCPDRSRIKNDTTTTVLLKGMFCKQRRDIAAFNICPRFIKEKTSIGISIPCDA